MENFIKENKIIITVISASIILGGFYYFSEANKSASIERQQQAELQAKKDQEEARALQISREASQRTACARESAQGAVDLNKASCARGEYCIRGEDMYSVTQYNNLYNVCLQRMGLK